MRRRVAIFLIAALLLGVGAIEVLKYPLPRGTEFVTSYSGDGYYVNCTHPIEVNVRQALWSNSPQLLDPVNTSEFKQFCKQAFFLRTEAEGETKVLARPEILQLLHIYPHNEITVQALKFSYIKDQNFMARLLPAYKGRDIGCIIIVEWPGGKHVYLEDEHLDTFEEMDYGLFDQYLKAASANDRKTFLDNLN